MKRKLWLVPAFVLVPMLSLGAVAYAQGWGFGELGFTWLILPSLVSIILVGVLISLSSKRYGWKAELLACRNGIACGLLVVGFLTLAYMIVKPLYARYHPIDDAMGYCAEYQPGTLLCSNPASSK